MSSRTSVFRPSRRIIALGLSLATSLTVVSSTSGEAFAEEEQQGEDAPYVQPASEELLTTRLEMPKGNIVHPGKSIPIIAVFHNNGFESAEKFGVYVQTPTGTRVTTKNKNWNCATSSTSQGYKCSYNSVLTNETSTEATFSIVSFANTPPGKGMLTFTPFTSSAKEIESQTTPYTIVDLGDAVLLPHIQHLKNNKWKKWTNGSYVKAYTHSNFTYRIVVENKGHEVLKKGSTINLHEKIGKNVDLVSAKVALGYGTCTTKNKTLDCALRASKDIQKGAHLTTVDVTVNPRAEDTRVNLGLISVVNPVSKAKHSTNVNLKAEHRPASVNIELHHRTHADAGGTAQIDVKLENISKDITHKSFTMTAKLPREISFTKVVGTNWTCQQEVRTLDCIYKGTIAPKQISKKADIYFHVARSAAPNADGYQIDFLSEHAVRRLNLPVLAAIQVKAEASPSSLSTSSDIKNNMVRLDADETLSNGSSVDFTWVQRCTTAQDVANFDACPHGAPAPAAKLKNIHHPRAHALLPNVKSKTTFVFELLVTTDSSSIHKTVKVQATRSSVSSADVHAWATTVPTWINSALTAAQVTVTNPVLSKGNFTADATLPQSIIDRFGVPTNQKFSLTATETQGKECIVIHAGDTKATVNVFTFKTANMKAKYFEYIIAPSSCTYSGDTYNGLALKVQGEVFGNGLTFNGPVTLAPTFKVDLKATTTSMNVSLPAGSFKFKNVVIGLLVDDGAGTAKLTMGGQFNIFGLDIDVVGGISVPTGVGGAVLDGMQVTLTTSSSRTFKYGEVALKDMSLTIGLRYTPILATDKGLISVNGTGTLEFMGTSVRIDQMEVDFANGQVVSSLIKVSANMKIPSMKEAKADLSIMWIAAQPAKPLPADAPKGSPAPLPTPESLSVDLTAIFVTDSGFSIGTDANPAYLHYRSGQCISMGGQVIVPGILDATLSGYLVTGAPCMPAAIKMGDVPVVGTRSILAEVPLPVAPGDWRFDASNVKITLGGFTATGNFTIGKMYGVPYGSLDALIHLTSSDTKNTIYVQGSVDPLSGVKLKGDANLGVAGITTHFTIDAALTNKDMHIGATADLKLGGTTFKLAGYFGLEKYQGRDVPSQTFSASVPNFEIDGFKLGSAELAISQTPTSASVRAAMKVNLGVMKFDGAASFHTVKDGVAITVDADGSVKFSDKWEGDLSFHLSTCGNTDCTSMGSLKVTAGGSAVLQGKKFDLGTINFDTGGHFKEKVNYSDDSCSKSGTKGGIQFEGCFKYSLKALISDSAPYLSVDADASLHIKSRSRCTLCTPRRWYGWDSWGTYSAGIDISFDPFKLEMRVGSIDVKFSGS